jgi:hypothetical protein
LMARSRHVLYIDQFAPSERSFRMEANTSHLQEPVVSVFVIGTGFITYYSDSKNMTNVWHF